MVKDINLHVRLSEEESRALSALAEREGLTVSAWMRRLIHLHAKKEGVYPLKKRKGKEA